MMNVETEQFFKIEKKGQKVFNAFYRSLNIPYKRIYGLQNKEYDCVLLINGKWVRVEEKTLTEDWGNLLVETIQDTKTNSPGWFYTNKSELLLWLILPTKRIYQINIQKLKEFVELYKNQFNKVISEKGWGRTENIAIPWSTIITNNIGKIVK